MFFYFKDEISDIVEVRNESRCSFHKKVEDFLDAVGKFPIDTSVSHFQVSTIVFIFCQKYIDKSRSTSARMAVIYTFHHMGLCLFGLNFIYLCQRAVCSIIGSGGVSNSN